MSRCACYAPSMHVSSRRQIVRPIRLGQLAELWSVVYCHVALFLIIKYYCIYSFLFIVRATPTIKASRLRGIHHEIDEFSMSSRSKRTYVADMRCTSRLCGSLVLT